MILQIHSLARPWLGSAAGKRWKACSRQRHLLPRATAQHHDDSINTHVPVSHSVWSPTAARRTLAGGLLALALLAGDVFSPASLHLLQPLDAACHDWVVTNVPHELRSTLAAKVVSDAVIVGGLAGWLYIAGHTSLLQQEQQQWGDQSASSGDGSSGSGTRGVVAPWQALALAGVTYGLGGAFKHAEAFAVDLLKHSFMRVRPSLVSQTASFPSGHTTAAVVISGLLLFLLLPTLRVELQRHARERPAGRGAAAAAAAAVPPSALASSDLTDSLWALSPSAAAVNEAGGGAGASRGDNRRLSAQTAEPAVPATWLDPLLQHRGPVWVGCGLVTASGRVLADAHWLSDTLAGGCLGAALVSATVLTWEALGGGVCHEQERAKRGSS